MMVAGCDVGSLTAKAVVMEQGKIVSSSVILSRANPADSARDVMQRALAQAGLTLGDMDYVVGTGYGKEQIAFANGVESEISCHARGAWWDTPSVRTVIDIGGQDAKAIRIDDTGKLIRYVYNDKCASGTGRFLEVMADALELKIDEMGEAGQQARDAVTISNQCVIFAETEVISLLNEGKDVRSIVKGLHHAMANRVASLAKGIGVEQDVVMTGGVAKNKGMFEALAAGLAQPIKALGRVDPQINGAVGAALFAEEFLKSGGSQLKEARLHGNHSEWI